MVLFFSSSEGYTIYMGEDKYANEDLIKYDLPEDIWFGFMWTICHQHMST